MHFVYKTDNLYRSIRVSYGNSSFTKGFHFLNLFELHSFSVLKMHHSKPHHQFSTLSDFICYFSCIYWLFWAIRPSNWKAFQMNSEKVESWHGIIIWPTYHVQESREGYDKNWMHFVYKTDNLFRSIRVFIQKLVCYKGISFFWTYLNSIVFLCWKCTIQSHIINLQLFLTSFVIFHAFTNYF